MNEPQPNPTVPRGPANGALDRALAIVEFLRVRCPWDAAQTHDSLRRYLLEEAHEVVDAIDARADAALCDELGDLLLNLAFQLVIAEERSAFSREDVVKGLEAKMRRRHPHVYGDAAAVSWDAVKAAEHTSSGRGEAGLLGQIVSGADPLAHAHRVQALVATVGFDWNDAGGAWEKVLEEIDEVRAELTTPDPLRLEEEIGDLLFATVNFARLAGVHSSTALRRANAKFTRRFARVEDLARARGLSMEGAGLETLDELWNDVKKEEG